VSLEFGEIERAAALRLVTMALGEDLGHLGDITSQAFLEGTLTGSVNVIAREEGVIAGLPLLEMVFAELDSSVSVNPFVADGDFVERGATIASVSGNVRSLLTGERSALNFLSYLSGIATATRRYVRAIAGTRAKIYDTRKTIAGWRRLAKYAVRAGGGENHRMGLFDAVLIKDNHLAAWQSTDRNRTIAEAVRTARSQVAPGTIVEVEVDTLGQLADALEGAPDIVLLDNMIIPTIRAAIQLRDARSPKTQLEASGGITLETVAEIAATGIERISVGSLTHSVRALDLAFDWGADEA